MPASLLSTMPSEEIVRKLVYNNEFAYFLVLLEMLRYQLHLLHQTFGDDLASPLLFCELTMHEIRNVNPRKWGNNAEVVQYFEEKSGPRTNEHSLALATRLPPTTARRKIAKMVRRGWLQRDRSGNLRTSLLLHTAARDHVPAFIMEVWRAARQLQDMIQRASVLSAAKSARKLKSSAPAALPDPLTVSSST